MPLAEARGLLGADGDEAGLVTFLRHDPQADAAALEQLGSACLQFSPVVGMAATDTLVLEVSGSAHLFGGDARLLERFTGLLHARRLQVRAAIADTLGAAWAVARYGRSAAMVVPPGRLDVALAPLPVAALRLEPAVLAALQELGLRQIGQLLALPRASLPARFGRELIQRLDQALGALPEPITPIRPPEPLEASRELEYPTGERAALETLLRPLLAEVLARLPPGPLGVQQLEVLLVETDRRERRLTVGTLRPTRSAEHLLELLRTEWERLTLESEVRCVRLRVMAASPRSVVTRSLFDRDDSGGGRELAELVDRLSARLGRERVVRAVWQPESQPELALTWQPWLDPAATSCGATPHSAAARPVRLYARPTPVDVATQGPAGPPLWFTWAQRRWEIVRCWGPERIETGWWRARHIRRDYYRVETACGRRYWLFRRLGPGDWFVQGEYG